MNAGEVEIEGGSPDLGALHEPVDREILEPVLRDVGACDIDDFLPRLLGASSAFSGRGWFPTARRLRRRLLRVDPAGGPFSRDLHAICSSDVVNIAAPIDEVTYTPSLTLCQFV